MSLPESTTVLVVGAGPSGLTAALSLIHYGCHDIVIVDAVAEGVNASRAIVVHAATLEALDDINASAEMISRGVKAKDAIISTRSSELVRARFTLLAKQTAHPYILFIPQNVTEAVLGDKLKGLGITVHRPCKVIGMKQNEADCCMTDVRFDDGQVICAKYVIGADGARSAVRTLAGIGFADPEGAEGNAKNSLAQMVLADVTFNAEPKTEVFFNGVVSPASFFVLIPFSQIFNAELAKGGEPISKPVYRIGCGVPLADGEPPHAPPKEYVQGLIDKYGPTVLSSGESENKDPVTIDQIVWSTRFRTHSAIADRTFTRLGAGGATVHDRNKQHPNQGGIILLVGDAAHIHSPAGGQGMNLGLRDAAFLGKALSEHLKASESDAADPDDILRKFAEERHARALEVIGFTKKLLTLAGLPYHAHSWWMPFSLGSIRDLFLGTLGKLGFVQSRIAWRLSGLGGR